MRNRRVWLVAAAAVFLSACGSVKIGRVLADPTRYHNKNVRVEGTVTNSYGALVTGVYQVQDDTGKIYVLSNRGVPSKGAQVKVSGTVMNGVTVGGKPYGTAIRERDHKVKW